MKKKMQMANNKCLLIYDRLRDIHDKKKIMDSK